MRICRNAQHTHHCHDMNSSKTSFMSEHGSVTAKNAQKNATRKVCFLTFQIIFFEDSQDFLKESECASAQMQTTLTTVVT